MKCGSTEIQDRFFQQNPDNSLKWDALEKLIYQRMEMGQIPESGPPYSLPVVVHIIHNNGPENISDAFVQAAIQHLNEGFAHTGNYGSQGPGTDMQISFCLAKRTPTGTSTNGINRIQSALTDMTLETDDIAVKDLSRWNPTDYINIWIVKSINSLSSGPGVVGYAYLPSSHGQPEDGLVIEAGMFGSASINDVVVNHEMGHYLGLYHTFQGGCENNDCLAQGDRICDTPPDQGQHTACPFNSCQTDADAPAPNPFTTDVNDLTENFMDYSPLSCVYSFTSGQRTRMHQFLDGARSSLLQSKGCLSPCVNPLTAGFTMVQPNPVPANSVVNFINS